MITKTYKIAQRIIEITSIYENVHKQCKNYLYDGVPDFSVKIAQSDIDFEKVKSEAEDKAEGIAVRSFSDRYLETLAVYRKIAEKMIDYDTLLFHGSVVAVDGEGYLFTAKSGTGKSTHTRLWRELFGERAVMVNDDKPLIRITDSGITVFGTPWDGKHKLSTNTFVPLRAVCILTRDKTNHIEKLDKSEAYQSLLVQSYRPQTPERTAKMLNLLDLLADNCGLYRLGCNMDISAARIAYDGMKGK